MVVCKCVYFGECLTRMLDVPQSLRGEIVVGGEPSLRYFQCFAEVTLMMIPANWSPEGSSPCMQRSERHIPTLLASGIFQGKIYYYSQ